MNFGNSGDDISIEVDGLVIDQAANYGTAGISAGHSFSLPAGSEDAALNDDVAEWCESVSAIGETSDFGTPHSAGDSCGE